jgi:hypothetical protein
MALTDLIPLVFIGVTIITAVVQIISDKKERSVLHRIDILLNWIFLIIIGFGGIWAFIGHIFFADQVAHSIGWPAGNPFQQEVAFANLAIGVLGLLSFRIRGSFRIATIITYTIFMMGAGIGHIWQIISTGDLAVNNAGSILWIDLLLPPVIIIIYLMSLHLQHRKAYPSLRP